MTTSRNRNKVEDFELDPLPLLRHGMSQSEMHVIVIQHHTHTYHMDITYVYIYCNHMLYKQVSLTTKGKTFR